MVTSGSTRDVRESSVDACRFSVPSCRCPLCRGTAGGRPDGPSGTCRLRCSPRALAAFVHVLYVFGCLSSHLFSCSQSTTSLSSSSLSSSSSPSSSSLSPSSYPYASFTYSSEITWALDLYCVTHITTNSSSSEFPPLLCVVFSSFVRIFVEVEPHGKWCIGIG